jgi:protocatechuate 3,4-dioxygenase beta subunit
MKRSIPAALLLLFLAAGPTGSQSEEPRFTPPPGPDTPEVQAEIAKLSKLLAAKTVDVSGVLGNPAYQPLHDRPSFRELIRENARGSRVLLVTPGEPGNRLIVTGTVRRSDGKPAAGARVYAYQTSAKGWYSDKAPHVSGNSGDQKHARLFCYLTTDDQGRFEITTIRPGGYPRSTLPSHIHVEVSRPKGGARVLEILFDDDPRLTPELRQRAATSGDPIAVVQRSADRTERCSVEIALR